MRAYFSARSWEVIYGSLAALCILSDMRLGSLQQHKHRIKDVSKALKLQSHLLYTYLMLNREGLLRSSRDYVSCLNALIEALYASLVSFVVDRVNRRHRSSYLKFLYTSTYQREQAARASKASKLSIQEQQLRGTSASSLQRAEVEYKRLSPRTALILVDTFGFADPRLSASQPAYTDIGFGDFSSNLLYECLLGFFNRQRFEPSERLKLEGLEESFTRVKYQSNEGDIESLAIISSELAQKKPSEEIVKDLAARLGALDKEA